MAAPLHSLSVWNDDFPFPGQVISKTPDRRFQRTGIFTADLQLRKRGRKKELETEKKATADAISQTVKKRLEEINSSYDKEIGKGQDKLKKARAYTYIY